MSSAALKKIAAREQMTAGAILALERSWGIDELTVVDGRADATKGWEGEGEA